MTPVARILAVAVATILSSLLLVTVALADQASQLRPVNLRVAGGETEWNPDNDFQINWDRPAVSAEGFPIQAAHYLFRDPAGNVLTPAVELVGNVAKLDHLRVPGGPGRYTIDIWLEGPGQQLGPQVSATLRFDDARPGKAQPLEPSGWIAGNAPAIVTIEHPAAQPISGIRGYAVSVDRGSGGQPCAGPNRCSLEETDLRAGITGDRASLGVLPEGSSVVRVVAVSGSGVRSTEAGSAQVRVDATRPVVVLEGVPQGWANGPVQVTARATDSLSGMTPDGSGGPFTALTVDGAVPKAEHGGSSTAVVSGEGVHHLTAYARDAAGNLGEESAATVRIDEGSPLVAFASSQDPREPERIEATVTDPLSGPDPSRGAIAMRTAGSHQSFTPLPTRVSGTHLTAHWDSDAFPAGSYEFRVTAYDAAGNAASSDRRANDDRLVLANPLKKPTELVAGFGGRRLVWQHCRHESGGRRCRRESIGSFARRPTTRVLPYGRGTSFGGRLTAAVGAPLAGLPIEIVETFGAGSTLPPRTTTVETGADGTFVAHLLPGPSRRVTAGFAGTRTLTRAGTRTVGLDVRGGVRLHSSSALARIGGTPVIFSGRVGDLGASVPTTGRPVELQFRFPGSEWSAFRTVQTDGQGRFRYPYSFSDNDSRGIRFQFRAFVPAQDGWPYEPAFSRPVFVTGTERRPPRGCPGRSVLQRRVTALSAGLRAGRLPGRPNPGRGRSGCRSRGGRGTRPRCAAASRSSRPCAGACGLRARPGCGSCGPRWWLCGGRWCRDARSASPFYAAGCGRT
jgi:hypothetical protein